MEAAQQLELNFEGKTPEELLKFAKDTLDGKISVDNNIEQDKSEYTDTQETVEQVEKQQNEEIKEQYNNENSEEKQDEEFSVKNIIEETKKYVKEIEDKYSKEKEELIKQINELKETFKKREEELLNEINSLKESSVSVSTDSSLDVMPEHYVKLKKELDLLKKQNLTSDIIDRISNIEKELADYKKMKEEELQKQEIIKKNLLIKNEINEFIKNHTEFDLGADIEEIEKKYLEWIDNLKILFKTDDNKELSKIIDGYLNDTKIRKQIENANLKPDFDVKKYKELKKLYLLKNGKDENGNDIKDRFGNKVVYKSLEEVYWLLNRDNIIKNKINEEINKVVSKLKHVYNKPVVLDEIVSNTVSNPDVSNYSILDEPIVDIVKDKNKREELKTILDKLGLQSRHYKI